MIMVCIRVGDIIKPIGQTNQPEYLTVVVVEIDCGYDVFTLKSLGSVVVVGRLCS